MSRAKVWLIGGTSESAELARALSTQNITYVVTVTTSSATRLYPEQSRIRIGAMSPKTMATFVTEQNIRCILDASHPFARQISQQAIAFPIPYLRYERPAITGHIRSCPPTDHTATDGRPSSGSNALRVTNVASLDELIDSDLLQDQRVLFTLGYRNLARFDSLRQTSQLFARVLPSVDAITAAIAAGFSPTEIIALRPPVSLAVEMALWQQWNISMVVAKASGKPGGEAIKRQAAQALGIALVLIQRPSITYPKQTDSITEAVIFCTEMLRVY